jgi:ATP/maltotriose-dependent transcriptional regulator MalT
VRANFGLDSLMAYLQVGERSKADQERGELSRLASQTRHQQFRISAAAGDALFAMLDGRLEEAMKSAAIPYGTFSHILHGRLAGWLGDTEALEKDLTWNDRRRQDSAIIHRAYYLAQLGRLDEARQTLVDLSARHFEPPDQVISFGMTTLLLETVSISEDRAHAEVLLRILSNSRRHLAKPHAVLVPRHLGRLAALLGDRERARDLYMEAISFCEAMSYRPELALTRLDLARLLLDSGEREESLSLIALASGEFEAMGMIPWLEKAEALRMRPAGRNKVVSKYPNGLSEREVEVLRLIAAGKSNPEIALELTISLNTVQRHVANVLSKTNLANRTAAASYAYQHGLT